MISAVSIVLLGLHQVTTAVLQGLGHTKIPMINMVLAAVAKVILNWSLTAIPWLGIMGAAWATAADMGVAAFINLYFINRYIGYKMEISHLLKTVFAAVIMGVAVKLFYTITLETFGIDAFSIFGAVFVGVVVYVATLVAVGGVKRADLERIPMIGKYFIIVFDKLGIFKNEVTK